jgi:hypothetical protein
VPAETIYRVPVKGGGCNAVLSPLAISATLQNLSSKACSAIAFDSGKVTMINVLHRSACLK